MKTFDVSTNKHIEIPFETWLNHWGHKQEEVFKLASESIEDFKIELKEYRKLLKQAKEENDMFSIRFYRSKIYEVRNLIKAWKEIEKEAKLYFNV